MASIPWRAAPVMTLTVKQFLGGKAVRVVIGLSLIPVIFALIYLIDPEVDRPQIFMGNTVFTELMIPTLLPLTILVLATSAFGDEIEDRTLPYLMLKPFARVRIVLEKFFGSVLISGPIAIFGLSVTYLLAMQGEWNDYLRLYGAMVAATAMATIAYSAIFMLVSLWISRALVAALIYSFIWETILGRFVPGLRYVSIRHFVRSVFAAIAEDRRFDFKNSASLTVAVAVLLAASLVAILLSTWRLRRMNLE
jgi:ABC-2 type transport system permease protein